MVAAQETTLQELLEGSKQYQVPLYQRAYSWERPQLERLWTDVVDLAGDRAEDASHTHFLGSLVLAPSPANGPTGVSQFLVVDGQQRLTTLTILLCALRDRLALDDPESTARVNESYLVNRWKGGVHKLVPTQADRDAYRACVETTARAGGSDRVGTAYTYFTEKLETTADLDLTALEAAVMTGLTLVSVTAQHGDNVHRIFESLNNTGLKLSQADLLRNYLFMRLDTRGEQVHEQVWMPLQASLTNGELEQLFWFDLLRTDPRVKQTDTYARQQARLDKLRTEAEIEAEVRRLAALGALLRLVLHPKEEADPDVRLRLGRLQSWGTTTVTPVLLALLDRRSQEQATSSEVAQAMLLLESYLVRRMLIGRATSNLNRTLAELVGVIDSSSPVDEAVLTYLSTGRKYFGNDDEVRGAARTIPFYLNGRASQRAQVLRWLEESYASREPVELSTLTIEHVLPQTLTEAWREELEPELGKGETVAQLHHELMHTLGNLTLTGYNSSLSNSPFPVKRTKLAESGVRMSRGIVESARWGRAEIFARAEELAARVIDVWPGPLPGQGDSVDAAWETLDLALAALPTGRWTTYGELAVLVGSGPVAVGQRIAKVPSPHAYRVLQGGGMVSPGFRWIEEGRTDDPLELLRAEGVAFDDEGRADASQRLSAEELAELIGLGEAAPVQPRVDGRSRKGAASSEAFFAQLAAAQDPETVDGVRAFLDRWVEMGGALSWGTSGQTTCFMTVGAGDGRGELAPLVLRPNERAIVRMARLRARAPFDSSALATELEERLRAVPGFKMTPGAAWPSFAFSVLADAEAREMVVAALGWVLEQIRIVQL